MVQTESRSRFRVLESCPPAPDVYIPVHPPHISGLSPANVITCGLLDFDQKCSGRILGIDAFRLRLKMAGPYRAPLGVARGSDHRSEAEPRGGSRVHKLFLFFSSSVLKVMLRIFQLPAPSAASNSVDIIDLTDPPRALGLILRFIYPSIDVPIIRNLVVLSEAFDPCR